MRTIGAVAVSLLVVSGWPAPAAAQAARSAAAQRAAPDPGLSIRPFLMLVEQKFAAERTFDAVFGKSSYPFWGGGADVVFRAFFVEVSASRFERTGERAFHANGETFRLGIPLTATLTPVEVMAGYRFRRWPRVIPYGGAGFGRYRYKEVSDFSEPGEAIDERRTGWVAAGGVELRAHRWIGVGLDARWSRITDVIGKGGLSAEFDERDLGGVAARLKVVIGR